MRWNESAWSDVAAIRVVVARGWRRLLPHLDEVLLVTLSQLAFVSREGIAPISHAISLDEVRNTADAVVAALIRFTDVPVEQW